MSRFAVSRLLALVPVLIGVSMVVFLMSALIPGDPVDLLVGQGAQITSEERAQIRERLGLNEPLPVRYVAYVGGVVQGDLGRSVSTRRPVLQEILSQLPSTVQLAAASIAIGVLLGCVLGIIAALHRGTVWDTVLMLIAITGISVPVFWSALFLLLIFSVWLHWLPASGGQGLDRLAMPASALGYLLAASIARLVRSSMLEVLGQDYVTTARSKGLSERLVIARHALRNALIPVVTLIGLQTGAILSGTVIIETVFARPGMGRLLVQAIGDRDYPVVQGVVLFLALAYLLLNFAVDLVYAYIDPRIRHAVS